MGLDNLLVSLLPDAAAYLAGIARQFLFSEVCCLGCWHQESTELPQRKTFLLCCQGLRIGFQRLDSQRIEGNGSVSGQLTQSLMQLRGHPNRDALYLRPVASSCCSGSMIAARYDLRQIATIAVISTFERHTDCR